VPIVDPKFFPFSKLPYFFISSAQLKVTYSCLCPGKIEGSNLRGFHNKKGLDQLIDPCITFYLTSKRPYPIPLNRDSLSDS